MPTDGPDDELLLEAYAIIDSTPEMDETIAKLLDLPPAIARAFVKDMKAFFAEDWSGAAFPTHPYLPPRLCPLRTIDEGAVGDASSFGVSRDTLERRFSIGSFSARSKNESRRRVATSATAWADTLPGESVVASRERTVSGRAPASAFPNEFSFPMV